MLVLLIAIAIAASLLIELGLMVVRDQMEEQHFLEAGSDQVGPLLIRGERRLSGMRADCDDEAIDDVHRLHKHIEMTIGHRIEGAWIKSRRHESPF